MSKLIIHEPPLQVLSSLAEKIGLNEAIVLQQLHYWLENKKNKGREYNGHKWVFNTYADWQADNFPFWSINTIQRIFTSLEEQRLVISEQIDKHKHDMTKFYRVAYDQLEYVGMMEHTNLVSSITPNRDDVNKNTETTPETTIGANAPDLPLEWQIASGQEIKQVDNVLAYRTDVANLIDTGCDGAGALSMAFMQERGITFSIDDVKGQRKAAKAMLQKGVKPEHIVQATRDLVNKHMTIVDLFGVSKTAIDLANEPNQTIGRKPHAL